MKDENKLIIPDHIAFIMDGNGRWATNRGLSRSEGHKAGTESLDRIDVYKRQTLGYVDLRLFATSCKNASDVIRLSTVLESICDALIALCPNELSAVPEAKLLHKILPSAAYFFVVVVARYA